MFPVNFPGHFRSTELWNQRSYLARVMSLDAADGIRDEGIWPLADFVDSGGPDAVAATLEPTPDGHIYPALYVRRANAVDEQLLDPDPLDEFRGPGHPRALETILGPLLP